MIEYLGDGVYAEFDSALERIILTAEGNSGKDEIYLDREVYENLIRFIMGISIKNKKVIINDNLGVKND
tara:strand:+ start:1030 stop:1236 length:207 start_codon:yes stop_codon:yes gene_type:complete